MYLNRIRSAIYPTSLQATEAFFFDGNIVWIGVTSLGGTSCFVIAQPARECNHTMRQLL